jgi:hypothetical protein
MIENSKKNRDQVQSINHNRENYKLEIKLKVYRFDPNWATVAGPGQVYVHTIWIQRHRGWIAFNRKLCVIVIHDPFCSPFGKKIGIYI